MAADQEQFRAQQIKAAASQQLLLQQKHQQQLLVRFFLFNFEFFLNFDVIFFNFWGFFSDKNKHKHKHKQHKLKINLQ